METIVWWSARGGKVEIKKQNVDHCLVERRGGESLNKEASWIPLFGGAQGEQKFKERCFMETIVWWRTRGGEVLRNSFMETIVWWSDHCLVERRGEKFK